MERASGEGGEQRVLLEGRGGGGLKVVVIFGREGQGWGGWGHRRHGRGVGKLGALQEACSGNPPRDVNALSKRGPNPNPNIKKNDKTDCHNKTDKTHNDKTLPRPSANTHDRAPLSQWRTSVLSCVVCENIRLAIAVR